MITALKMVNNSTVLCFFCHTFACTVQDLIGKRWDVIEICQEVHMITLWCWSDRSQFALVDLTSDADSKYRHLSVHSVPQLGLRRRWFSAGYNFNVASIC